MEVNLVHIFRNRTEQIFKNVHKSHCEHFLAKLSCSFKSLSSEEAITILRSPTTH